MAVDNRLQSWMVEGRSLRVDCAEAVLNKIGMAAREGFRRFRHGGMEVGGILIGSRHGSAVRVLDARPMEIEYGRGAFFLLTDAEHETLHGLIQQTNQELAPRGQEVVGYYESHTRREVSLAETDLETYDGHFSDPLQVCIIQKPEKENTMITAVYVRDEGGNILKATSAGYSPSDLISEDVAPPAPQPVAVPLVVAPPDLTETPIELKTPAAPTNIDREPPRRIPQTFERIEPKLYVLDTPSSRRGWIYAAMVAALAAIAAVIWTPRGPAGTPASPNVAGPTQPSQSTPAGTPPQAPPAPTMPESNPPSKEVASKRTTTVKTARKAKRRRQSRSRRARARSTTR